MNYLEKWGCTLEKKYVYADDIENYDIGAVVKCIAEEKKYLICLYEDKTVRIRKSGFVVRKNPEFYWKDNVKILSKNIIAQIEWICWHFNEERYYYHLTSEGKKLKKRYYAEELEKID